MQIPIGVLIDRFGPRRLMSAAALLAALGSLDFALSRDIAEASLGRVMVGLGSSTSWIGTMVLASYFFPPQRFALLAGIGQMVGMVGAVFGQAPLREAVATFGWRDTTMAIAALGVAIALALFLTARDRPATRRHDGGIGAGLRAVAGNPQTWLFAYLGLALGAPLLAFAGLWAVPYFAAVYGLGRAEAALLATLVFAGWGIGAPTLGWLSDRLGRRRPLLATCCALVTAQLLLVFYVPALNLAAVQVLLFGIGFAGSSMTLTFACGRECNAAQNGGAALGLVNTAVLASGALLQPLIGWLLDVLWDGSIVDGARRYAPDAYRLALAVLPVVSAAGVVAALVARESHPRRRAPPN
jgi:MFS family permease